MDFTREPIIETVITPKEGSKLVVRSSKSNGQEEHFVDALEVVSFGHSFFFRSLERPKTFLVPATDYEVLEVREARMVLKNVGVDRAIKIAGGREAPMRQSRETQSEKLQQPQEDISVESNEDQNANVSGVEKPQENRSDKKRDRRRNYRRRGRGREGAEEETGEGETADSSRKSTDGESAPLVQQVMTTSILTSLLPPPSMLISETIAHYKDKFKEAFYPKDEDRREEGLKVENESNEGLTTEPASPASQEAGEYGSFELSEEDEGDIYRQRKLQSNELDNDEDLPIQHVDKSSSEESHNRDESSDSFTKDVESH